jgi:hypothetical protein
MDRPAIRKQSAPTTTATPSSSSDCTCCNHHHNQHPVRPASPPATPPTSYTPVMARRPQGVVFAEDHRDLTPANSITSISGRASPGNVGVNLNTRGSITGSNALLPGSSGNERRPSVWSSQAIMDRRPSAMLQLGTCGACGDQRRFLIR